MEKKEFLVVGYSYDQNGFHNGPNYLHSVEEIIAFIFTDMNDKLFCDVYDFPLFTTRGALVDRFQDEAFWLEFGQDILCGINRALNQEDPYAGTY